MRKKLHKFLKIISFEKFNERKAKTSDGEKNINLFRRSRMLQKIKNNTGKIMD